MPWGLGSCSLVQCVMQTPPWLPCKPSGKFSLHITNMVVLGQFFEEGLKGVNSISR